MKLVDKHNNIVKNGAELTSFRGEKYTLESKELPKHSGSTGRVYVKDSENNRRGFYPSVFGLKFVE